MRDILIIILSGIVYVLAFAKVPQPYIPFKEQAIYDRFASKETEGEDEYVFTLIDLSKAKDKKPAQVEKVIRRHKTARRKEVEKRIKKAVAKPKPKMVAELNYYSIRNIVKESENSYYYPRDLKNESGGVTLRLISFTPYNNKGILKVNIENKGGSYFFIGGTSISGPKGSILEKTFGEQFAKPNSTLTIFCMIQAKTKQTLTLEVIESGKSKKTLKLDFNLP